MSDKRFVKSADTKTAAVNSRAQIDKMLRRYGATAIATSENIEAGTVTVSFIVPDSGRAGASQVPVKIPISIRAVYDVMYGRPTKWSSGSSARVFDPKGYDPKKLQQAERVAWRNLVLWIDAALSAASIGLQTITEAFFAHAVVGAGGERMVELIEQAQQQLGPGVQRLLMAPADES